MGGRGRWISEVKASLVYRVSSRTARATQRNPVLKNQKKKNKNKKNKKERKKERKEGKKERNTASLEGHELWHPKSKPGYGASVGQWDRRTYGFYILEHGEGR